jgi:hypothetical protein
MQKRFQTKALFCSYYNSSNKVETGIAAVFAKMKQYI